MLLKTFRRDYWRGRGNKQLRREKEAVGVQVSGIRVSFWGQAHAPAICSKSAEKEAKLHRRSQVRNIAKLSCLKWRRSIWGRSSLILFKTQPPVRPLCSAEFPLCSMKSDVLNLRWGEVTPNTCSPHKSHAGTRHIILSPFWYINGCELLFDARGIWGLRWWPHRLPGTIHLCSAMRIIACDR